MGELPKNSQEKAKGAAAQQEAARSASDFGGLSKSASLYAAGSGLRVLLGLADEGITFGLDTPITITFGAAALNSFASGNINAIQNFDVSHLAELGAEALARSLPGVGDVAENVVKLAAHASALAEDARKASQ